MKKAPTIKDLSERKHFTGYEQIYIVKKKTKDASRDCREVFFTCGEWCYDGFVEFDFLQHDEMTISNLPMVAGCLQKHQDSLSFVCMSDR